MAILDGLIVARFLCGNYAPESPPGRVVLHKRLLAENYGEKKMGKKCNSFYAYLDSFYFSGEFYVNPMLSRHTGIN